MAAPAGARRAVRLGPGEFVGGSFPEAEGKMGAPGSYRLDWAVAVTWNGRALTLPAAALSIERRTR